MFDPKQRKLLEIVQRHQYVSPGEHGLSAADLERLYVDGYVQRTDLLQDVPVYTLSFQGRCVLLPRIRR